MARDATRILRWGALLLVLTAGAPAPAAADPADALPAGARAYLELRDPAGALDALLASPLGRALRQQAAVQAFWGSARGMELTLSDALVEGATGKSFRALLRTVGSGEVALGLYPPLPGSAPGTPARAVLALRADPAELERVLGSAERFLQRPRRDVAPARGARSALWTYDKFPVYGFREGSLWVFASDRALAEQAHAGPAANMGQDARLAEARRSLARRGLALGVADADALPRQLQPAAKPAEPLGALLLGAAAEQAARAPWLAAGAELAPAGERAQLAAELLIPTPRPASRPVARAYGGTLAALPFALGKGGLGSLRLHRDLAAFLQQPEALLDPPGPLALRELVERFGALSGNLKLVDEFLPRLYPEVDVALLGPESQTAAGAADELRLPEVAVLLRMRQPRLAAEAALGFRRLIQADSARRRARGEPPWILEPTRHAGARLQVARAALPASADASGAAPLAAPAALEPTQASLGDYLVLGSCARAVRAALDARGSRTAAPPGSNARLEIDGAQAAALLRTNRAALIARARDGGARSPEAAERAVDLWFAVADFVERASLTQREAKVALALELELSLGPGAR